MEKDKLRNSAMMAIRQMEMDVMGNARLKLDIFAL